VNRRIWLGMGVASLALSQASSARGEPPVSGQADALFEQAMDLRSAGNDAAACPKFAASKQLAPAIGVTLYLAECYERTGRSASAWREFREAEKMAGERNDKRAEVAGKRAAALEPSLDRLTVGTPGRSIDAGTVVTVDGAALAPEFLGHALAVDPGDHTVTITSLGQAARTLIAHVDAATPTAIVRIDAAQPSEVTLPPAATADTTPAATTETGDRGVTGRFVGMGLVVAGAAGIGIGTWLLTDKVRDLMPNGQLCDPRLRAHAIPEGIVALSAGGVAVISGVSLYYVSRPHHAGIALSPAIVPSGAGALLSGSF